MFITSIRFIYSDNTVYSLECDKTAERFYIFLQGKPKDVDLEEVKKRLEDVAKVKSLHHTHIWSLEGEHNVFITHVVLNEINTFNDILEVKREVKEILKGYGFSHFTVEVELNEESCSLR